MPKDNLRWQQSMIREGNKFNPSFRGRTGVFSDDGRRELGHGELRSQPLSPEQAAENEKIRVRVAVESEAARIKTATKEAVYQEWIAAEFPALPCALDEGLAVNARHEIVDGYGNYLDDLRSYVGKTAGQILESLQDDGQGGRWE